MVVVGRTVVRMGLNKYMSQHLHLKNSFILLNMFESLKFVAGFE
jgi:hypothetical protein